MEPFVRRFLRAGLIWLGVGVLLGGGMVFVPFHTLVYRPAHMHANLLGFVSMFIFGVAYHVIPRFVGRPLHSPRLAATHLWIANAGVLLLVLGWLARPHAGALGTPLLHGGASLSMVSAFAFIFNIWRTLDAAGAPVQLGGMPGRGSVLERKVP